MRRGLGPQPRAVGLGDSRAGGFGWGRSSVWGTTSSDGARVPCVVTKPPPSVTAVHSPTMGLLTWGCGLSAPLPGPQHFLPRCPKAARGSEDPGEQRSPRGAWGVRQESLLFGAVRALK